MYEIAIISILILILILLIITMVYVIVFYYEYRNDKANLNDAAENLRQITCQLMILEGIDPQGCYQPCQPYPPCPKKPCQPCPPKNTCGY